MKAEKLFFNNLLALAFACTVSILFAHGITRFINTGSKKHNENVIRLFQHSNPDEVDAVYFTASINHIKSPVEIVHTVKGGASFFQTASYKIIRPVILDAALARIQSQPCNVASIHQFKLRGGVWSPSIPIAQRKLLI